MCSSDLIGTFFSSAYAEEKKVPMPFDIVELETYATEVILGDFASESDLARHDSDKIAKVLAEL